MARAKEMIMAKYFTFYELIHSNSAKEYGIKNMPNSLDEYRNIDALMTKVLDPLREKLGHPIYVTSGYRSRALNALVHGVINSQHLVGEAADITPNDPTLLMKLWDLIKAKTVKFDQAILYTKRKFIHISYSRTGWNRGEILYDTESW